MPENKTMTATDSNAIGDPVINVQPATPTSPNSVSPPHLPVNSNNFPSEGGGGFPNLVSEQPKRRVSIITDPIGENRLGHDNLAFEQNPRRKISSQSEHSEVGPVRRKSILHNSGHDNESVHSHHSYTGKKIIMLYR